LNHFTVVCVLVNNLKEVFHMGKLHELCITIA